MASTDGRPMPNIGRMDPSKTGGWICVTLSCRSHVRTRVTTSAQAGWFLELEVRPIKRRLESNCPWPLSVYRMSKLEACGCFALASGKGGFSHGRFFVVIFTRAMQAKAKLRAWRSWSVGFGVILWGDSDRLRRPRALDNCISESHPCTPSTYAS
jgi:hypothetical protein